MAPFIFTILLDYIVRKVYTGRDEIRYHLKRRQSRRVAPHCDTYIKNSVNDIDILTEDVDQAQR